MKVVKKDNYMRFGSLEKGTVCVDLDDEVLMKIDPIATGKVIYNAVSLETGSVCQLTSDAKVLVVPASVTITI